MLKINVIVKIACFYVIPYTHSQWRAISAHTITMFPGASLISSNYMGWIGKIRSPSMPCLDQTSHL